MSYIASLRSGCDRCHDNDCFYEGAICDNRAVPDIWVQYSDRNGFHRVRSTF